jgi:nitric oxide reductase subunit B
MLFASLVPVRILQLHDSFQNGYRRARSSDHFLLPTVRVIEWLRLPGDLLFIVGGILPLVYLALRIVKERKRCGQLPVGEPTEGFMRAPSVG